MSLVFTLAIVGGSLRVMRIEQLWRYPVKSLGGERLTEVDVEHRGLVGDRRWGVVDTDGKLGSGKSTRGFRTIDGLLHLGAVTGPDSIPQVAGPFGWFRADDPALTATLSEHLAAEVRLAVETDVAYHDDSAVHLVTTAGLAWLATEIGTDEPIEDFVRRFRPNLVVDTTGSWPAEDGWPAGTQLEVGDTVRLRVTKPTKRCVMTTMTQPGLDGAPSVLRTLGRLHDAEFGVYAEVINTGTIHAGDHVRVG